MPDPLSVFLIKPGSLGDIVHALPVVGDIRRTWPQARLTWLVDQRWRPLLEQVPGLDEIMEFPREKFRGLRGWWEGLRWMGRLRGLAPDLAFDLQGLLRSALMGRVAGAQKLVGGRDAREGARWLYHVQVPVQSDRHAVERYRQIVAAGGVSLTGPPTFPLGPGHPPPNLPTSPFLLVHPYARGGGKSLSPEQVLHLLKALHPWPVVLVGRGPSPPGLPNRVINLLNQTTLAEFIWLARRARWVVSVDSGPAHIAAAVNDALLCLHTWSDPRRVGPYNERAFIWRGGSIYQQNLALPELPGSARHQLSKTDLEAIAAWLKQRADAPPPPRMSTGHLEKFGFDLGASSSPVPGGFPK